MLIVTLYRNKFKPPDLQGLTAPHIAEGDKRARARADFFVIFPPPAAEVLPDGAFPPVHGAYRFAFINGAEKVFWHFAEIYKI